VGGGAEPVGEPSIKTGDRPVPISRRDNLGLARDSGRRTAPIGTTDLVSGRLSVERGYFNYRDAHG
jgi:hypothetical protein